MHSQPKRSLAKTATYRTLNIFISFLIFSAVTQSWGFGALLVGVDALASTVLYYLHERVWARIRWGKEFKPGELFVCGPFGGKKKDPLLDRLFENDN